MDEMDNDSFIQFLEENPTYNRSQKKIAAIRKPAKKATPKDTLAEPVEDDTQSASPIIRF
jgi:hypothetical protein